MKIIKINKIIYSFLLGILVTTFSLQSCTSELDINEDPNNPVTVPLRTIMTASQVNLGYTLGGECTRIPASVMQYYAGHRGQPLDYTTYNITPSSSDGLWTNMYDVLMDLREIENKGTASGDLVYVGVSQILQAYTFSVITDLYGDIPYSEALMGIGQIAPKYDKQEAIYTSLIQKIETGITNVKSNQGLFRPSTDDLIYGGNVSKWERFGNSLKLRLLNHLSKRTPGAAAAFLAQNPALIDDFSINAKVPFLSSASSSNPVYQFDVLSGRKDQAVASTIVDKMKSLADPRLNQYFYGVKNNDKGFQGQIIGNIPGQSIDDSGENLYSRVGPGYASINSPVMLMSAAEVHFIRAEIYKNANDDTSAKAAYEKAISQDFSALGVSAGYAGYIGNANVAYNNTLQRIMEQKWITMYQAPFESWVDWRRTGYPALTLPTVHRTDFVPRRIPYPQIEINVNGASLEAGPGIPVPFTGMGVKMWWDQ